MKASTVLLSLRKVLIRILDLTVRLLLLGLIVPLASAQTLDEVIKMTLRTNPGCTRQSLQCQRR